MASKWAKLKGKVPAKVAGDQSFVERVDLEKKKISGFNLKLLTQQFQDLDRKKDEHEAEIKELNVRLEALSQLLIERFDESGVTSVNAESGATLYQRIDPQPTIEDSVAFESYLAENTDLDYLWKVHPSSLASLIRGLLEEGRDSEIPPGVKVYLRESIGMRKG